MKLLNGTLILDSQLTNEQINEVVSKLVLDFDEIKEVQIENLDKGVATSALFSLLYSIKKRKVEIKVPLIDSFEDISFMGKVHFVK